MASACIAFENLADSATLTTSSAELLLPVQQLTLTPHVARKWRSRGTSEWVLADLGSLTNLDTIGLFGTNATTYRVRVSSVDDSGLTGDLYDSGVHAVETDYFSLVTLIPSVVTGRYVRIDLTTTAEYVEAGRLVISERTQFQYNFVKGWGRQWIDRSLSAKTRGGQTQINPDVKYRDVNVSFDFITESDRNGFVETIDRVNGKQKDILFIQNPSSTRLARDSIWGLISEPSAVVQTYHNAFSKQYRIEERL